MAVPLFATDLGPLIDEVAERQAAVLRSGRYILGPEVQGFEAEFAEYIGVKHCVGVGNGTDALTIAIRALGIERGAEVIVPALTFYATAEAVVNAGAVPVFCDIDTASFCMTAETVELALTERTAALLPVHLFGNVAPMNDLAAMADQHGLRILEDAAQAAGASYAGRMAGGIGDAGAFSFFPSKNLGGFGDGGAVVTDDDRVADAARRLRFHGSSDKKIHEQVGYNSRLDELQAAGLRVLLPHLPDWTNARRAAAAAYAEVGLGELVTLPTETDRASHCYHLYVVRLPQGSDREALTDSLRTSGIGARAYYTTPLHRQPAMEPYAQGAKMPGADDVAACTLALPMGPELDAEQARTVVAELRAALSR